MVWASYVARKLIYTFIVNDQLDALFNVFISLLYMFRATQCSSSGESIVSIHHLVKLDIFLTVHHELTIY